MTDRRGLLARIHILKKELNLSDEEYRTMLRNGFSAESSAQLCEDDLSQLAATMEGIKSDMSERSDMSDHNQKKSSKKIWAAWYDLRQYLPIGKRSANYLCGIAKRNAPGIDLIRDAITVAGGIGKIRGLVKHLRTLRKMVDAKPDKYSFTGSRLMEVQDRFENGGKWEED